MKMGYIGFQANISFIGTQHFLPPFTQYIAEKYP